MDNLFEEPESEAIPFGIHGNVAVVTEKKGPTMLYCIFTTPTESISALYPELMYRMDSEYPKTYSDPGGFYSDGMLGIAERELPLCASHIDLHRIAWLAANWSEHQVYWVLTQYNILCLIETFPAISQAIREDVLECGSPDEISCVDIFLACLRTKLENLIYSGFVESNAYKLIEQLVSDMSRWYLTADLVSMQKAAEPTERISNRRTPCSIQSSDPR